MSRPHRWLIFSSLFKEPKTDGIGSEDFLLCISYFQFSKYIFTAL